MTTVANLPAARKSAPFAGPLLSVRNLTVRFFTHDGTVHAVNDVWTTWHVRGRTDAC